jgi:hypothetical protein
LNTLILEIPAYLKFMTSQERQNKIESPFFVPIILRNCFHELSLVVTGTI